jgi:hypothetical protein
MGGVNHCTSHCSLATFCVLIIMGKYGAVIGENYPVTWKFRLGKYKGASLPANHSVVLAHDDQNTKFCQTTA